MYGPTFLPYTRDAVGSIRAQPMGMAWWLRFAPLVVVAAYVGFTYCLFLFAPFQWPMSNHLAVLLVFSSAMLCFSVGFKLGVTRPAAQSHSLPIKPIVIIGGFLALIVLVPSARVYSGKWPWELAAALADQTKAYQSIGDQLRDTEGQRGLIAFVRAASAPIILAGSTLGVIYWRQLNGICRFFTVAAFWTSINFSILRGTNREIVDTAILIISSFAILSARQKALTPNRSLTVGKIVRTVFLGLVLLSLAYVIIAIFFARVNDRLGEQALLCIGETGVCADFNLGIYQFLPFDVTRAIGLIASYLSTGYFGTALALNENFVSGWGLGHSPALLSIYMQYIGQPEAVASSYPYMLYYQKWDPAAHWSGMMTWIAADVGFTGAVIIMGLFGYLYGRTWFAAVAARNDAAVPLFCLLSLTMFYFPGNFQLAIYIDGYVALLSSVLLFKFWRPDNRRTASSNRF